MRIVGAAIFSDVLLRSNILPLSATIFGVFADNDAKLRRYLNVASPVERSFLIGLCASNWIIPVATQVNVSTSQSADLEPVLTLYSRLGQRARKSPSVSLHQLGFFSVQVVTRDGQQSQRPVHLLQRGRISYFLPSLIGIEGCHTLGKLGGIRSEVLLEYGSGIADNERHDP
jgi:hypothetical protein